MSGTAMPQHRIKQGNCGKDRRTAWRRRRDVRPWRRAAAISGQQGENLSSAADEQAVEAECRAGEPNTVCVEATRARKHVRRRVHSKGARTRACAAPQQPNGEYALESNGPTPTPVWIARRRGNVPDLRVGHEDARAVASSESSGARRAAASARVRVRRELCQSVLGGPVPEQVGVLRVRRVDGVELCSALLRLRTARLKNGS